VAFVLGGGSTKVWLRAFFAEQEYGFAGAANCFAAAAAAKQSAVKPTNCFVGRAAVKQSAAFAPVPQQLIDAANH